MKVDVFYNKKTLDVTRFDDAEKQSLPLEDEHVINIHRHEFETVYDGSLSNLVVGYSGPFAYLDIRKKITSADAQKKYYNHGYISYDDFMKSTVHCNHFGPNYKNFLGSVVKEKAKREIIQYTINSMDHPFDYFEFGVHEGDLLNYVSSQITDNNVRLYGFDTFSGLPEDWISIVDGKFYRFMEKGELNATDIAIDDLRVLLVKGLFQDSLLPFLKSYKNRQKLIVIDSDLYSSALFVLTTMHQYLLKGDIIYFDEFLNDMNEFYAFNDYIRSYYMKDRLECIGKTCQHFAFRVI